MNARFRSLMRMIAVGVGLVWIVALAVAAAQQPGTNAVAIDNDDIGGVVTSASGPEAGVWVIAETSQLPTKFAKIVVTDDSGRYLIPDLPKANYRTRKRPRSIIPPATGRRSSRSRRRATFQERADAATAFPRT